MTLCECIKVHRSDLFIKHFDSVYQSMLSSSHEKEFSLNSQQFQQILKAIFQYDGHIELEYMMKRFERIEKTVLLNHRFLGATFMNYISIGVCRLLIQQNYHLDENDDNDHYAFVGILTKQVVMNGDLELFDRICHDYLDHTNNKNNINFERTMDDDWHSWGSCKDLFNNNQSKYDILFYMVKKLIGYSLVDLRSELFIIAMECDKNNQEIIKWIRYSYDSKDDFIKLCQQHKRVISSIEMYATTHTLELIEFKLQSPPVMSTVAAKFGNLDFLSHMYDMKEYKYLFDRAQLAASLSDGHLECANFLMKIKAKEVKESEHSYTHIFWTIHPSIMSLDLVKRLVDSQCQMMDFTGLIESAIKSNQPETLEFILSLLKEVSSQELKELGTRFVLVSLKVDNQTITEMLLDKFFSSEDQQPQTFKIQFNDNKICYAPLLSLFNKGHSIEIKQPKQTALILCFLFLPKVVQLLIDRLSLERVPPWVILASVNHPDFNDQSDYKLLKHTISIIHPHTQEDLIMYQQIMNLTCRIGLIKVVECLGDWVWQFGVSLFRTALEYKHIQLAYYIGQSIATHCDDMTLMDLLPSLHFIHGEQDFEMFWNLLKPITSNASHVSIATYNYKAYKNSQRHRITNTIDRIIKHYTRYYNGPEKDEFEMIPIKIYSNLRLPLDPFNINHLYTNYRDCPVIDFSDFNIDQYYIQNIELGIIPFNN
ncbi:hypothetical protein DFA_04978 [Cavenderia fasciculata]|uniref:Uncharacterized protein n=1 Tax=Cavenderia fasciculata TaxID=261658 RepID=F4PMQ1_CACFS|nr:uncharacterized protein DFA_04978 [Cavenderia fasciculata]EGG22848.1 hypothetical protein DFA_04978 [Cavenderia fasciculata]|eukprot:XP_004360699.1 hypothetical protein DFA_04978 [Cavenderia fasciculata]